jgi:thioredoxin-dependent peroxiredoxin
MDGDALHVGSMAPEFTLPDQNGKWHALADYRGRWVFLYFYPKDGTPGCVEEARAIKDHYDAFCRCNAVVLGVSGDSVESHRQFAAKHQLPFSLLSDIHKKTAERYGALLMSQLSETGNGKREIMRKSFLINIIGEIEKIYENIKPRSHAGEVLEDLAKMESGN